MKKMCGLFTVNMVEVKGRQDGWWDGGGGRLG